MSLTADDDDGDLGVLCDLVAYRTEEQASEAAVLHTGTTLKLRDVWTAKPPAGRPTATTTLEVPARGSSSSRPRDDERSPRHRTSALAIVIAVLVGGIVILVTTDVIIGIALGAAAYAIGTRTPRLSRRQRHSHSGRR